MAAIMIYIETAENGSQEWERLYASYILQIDQDQLKN